MKRGLLITLLLCCGALFAEYRPKISVSAGWGGLFRPAKEFGRIYEPFTMAPRLKVDVRTFAGLSLFAAIQFTRERGASWPAPDYEAVLTGRSAEIGLGYQLFSGKAAYFPYLGYAQLNLKEQAMDQSSKARAEGGLAGLAVNMYLSKRTFFMIDLSYSLINYRVDNIRFNLAGPRLQFGVGTHLRLLESRYSVE